MATDRDRRLTLNKGPLLEELTSHYAQSGQKPNSYVAMCIEKWLGFEKRGLSQDMADWLVSTPQLITFLAALKQASAHGGTIDTATQNHLSSMIHDIIGTPPTTFEQSTKQAEPIKSNSNSEADKPNYQHPQPEQPRIQQTNPSPRQVIKPPSSF